MSEASSPHGHFVAGPVWQGDECWTSEVQTFGGYGVVATIHGPTEAEVIRRRDVVLFALSASPPHSQTYQQGIEDALEAVRQLSVEWGTAFLPANGVLSKAEAAIRALTEPSALSASRKDKNDE